MTVKSYFKQLEPVRYYALHFEMHFYMHCGKNWHSFSLFVCLCTMQEGNMLSFSWWGRQGKCHTTIGLFVSAWVT